VHGASIGGGVFVTTDGQQLQADLLLFATGYRQVFPFLRDRPTDEHGNHA
jgi:hypothetical protein